MFTWALSLSVGLLSLLGEELPPPAPDNSVVHAARLYRIEVYNQFRQDRAEYDRRIAQGEQLLAAFQNSCEPRETDAVIDWFATARHATRAPNMIAWPALPELSGPAAPDGEHLIVTSEQTRAPLPAAPADAATTLDVQLPPQAEQTGPVRGVPSLVKQVFTTLRSNSPEADGTTAPVVIELPADRRVIDTTVPPVTEKPAKSPAKPKAEVAPKSAKPAPVATEDPFAVKALFEPATTPAPASEAATDIDPFAP